MAVTEELLVKISVDSKDVSVIGEVDKTVKKFDRSVDSVNKNLKKTSKSMNEVGKSSSNIKKTTEQFDAVKESIKAARSSFDNLARDLHSLPGGERFAQVGDSALKMAEDFASSSTAVEKMISILQTGLAGALVFAASKISSFASAMGDKIGAAFDRFSQKSAQFQDVIAQLQFSVKGFSKVFGEQITGSLEFWNSQISKIRSTTTNTVKEISKSTKLLIADGSRIGLTAQQNAKLLQVSADAAANSGRKLNDTTLALINALNGSTQAASAYGFALREEALGHSEYAKSLNKNVSELTDLEKVQLRYNVILEQSIPLTGAAEAKTKTLAGQTATLARNMEELEAKMGESNIQANAYTRAMVALTNVALALPDPLLKIVSTFGEMFGILLSLTGAVIKYGGLILGLKVGHAALSAVIATNAGAFGVFNTVLIATAANLGITLGSVTTLSGAFTALATIVRGGVVAGFTSLVSLLPTVLGVLVPIVLQVAAFTASLVAAAGVIEFTVKGIGAFLGMLDKADVNINSTVGFLKELGQAFGLVATAQEEIADSESTKTLKEDVKQLEATKEHVESLIQQQDRLRLEIKKQGKDKLELIDIDRQHNLDLLNKLEKEIDINSALGKQVKTHIDINRELIEEQARLERNNVLKTQQEQLEKNRLGVLERLRTEQQRIQAEINKITLTEAESNKEKIDVAEENLDLLEKQLDTAGLLSEAVKKEITILRQKNKELEKVFRQAEQQKVLNSLKIQQETLQKSINRHTLTEAQFITKTAEIEKNRLDELLKTLTAEGLITEEIRKQIRLTKKAVDDEAGAKRDITFADIGKSIRSFLGVKIKAGTPFLESIGEAFKQIGTNFKESLEEDAKTIKGIYEATKKNFKEKGFNEGLQINMDATVGSGIQLIKDGAEGMWEAAERLGSKVAEMGVGEAITGVLAVPDAINAVSGIITQITNFPQMLLKAVAGFGDALTKFIRELPANITKFAEQIGPLIEGILDSVIEFFLGGGLEKLLGAILRAIPKIIFGVFSAIQRSLKKLFSGRGGSVQVIDDKKAQESIDKIRKRIRGSTSELFRVQDSELEAAGVFKARQIEEAIDRVNRSTLELWQQGWDEFLDSLANWNIGLVKDLSEMPQNIADGLSNLGKSIGKQAASAWRTVLNAAEIMGEWGTHWWEVINGLSVEGIKEWGGHAADSFKGGLADIGDIFTDIWKGLGGMFTNTAKLFEKAGGSISNAFRPITNVFAKVGGAISDAFRPFTDAVASLGLFNFSFNTDALSTSLSSLSDFNALDMTEKLKPVTDAFQPVMDFFGELGAKLKTALKDAIPDIPGVSGGGGGGFFGQVARKLGIPGAHNGEIIPGIAPIPGDSPLNDRVLRLLSPGEFVLSREMVASLDRLFSGVQGLAFGGPVAQPIGASRIENSIRSIGNVPEMMSSRSAGNTEQTFNISIKIDTKDSNLDEKTVRTKIVPALMSEIKKSSQAGRFVMSSKGIR